MDSGVPGAPGVAVLRPVDQVVGLGLGDVILQLQLMVEGHVLVTALSLQTDFHPQHMNLLYELEQENHSF